MYTGRIWGRKGSPCIRCCTHRVLPFVRVLASSEMHCFSLRGITFPLWSGLAVSFVLEYLLRGEANVAIVHRDRVGPGKRLERWFRRPVRTLEGGCGCGWCTCFCKNNSAPLPARKNPNRVQPFSMKKNAFSARIVSLAVSVLRNTGLWRTVSNEGGCYKHDVSVVRLVSLAGSMYAISSG